MREFKKKIMAALAAAALAAGNVSATGLPVLDISNLMNGIMQLYQMYEEISNVVTQVQNTYKQIEQAVNQVKSFDWSNVGNAAKKYANSWSDLSNMSPWEILTNKEKVLATKGALTNLTRSVSDSVNVYTNVYHQLDEQTVTINGKKFSPLGLFGVGKHGDGTAISLGLNGIAAWAKDQKDLIHAFGEEKTPDEKAATMRQYGIDNDMAFAIEAADAVIDGESDAIIALGSELGEQNKKVLDNSFRAGEKALQELAADDESMTQHLEAIVSAVDNASQASARDIATLKRKAMVDELRAKKEEMRQKAIAEQEIDIENNEDEVGKNGKANANKANMEVKKKPKG